MPAIASAVDAELLQKLSMESQNKTPEGHEATNTPSGIQYGSLNGVEALKSQMQLSDSSAAPLLPEYVDHNTCYLPNGYLYYGVYDGSMDEWDYSQYAEGMEVPLGVYGDMYNHGYGYAPYGAYHSSGTPVPSLGHDGFIYGEQHYQYPSPYYPPQAAMNGTYYSNNSTPLADVSAAAIADKSLVNVESVKLNSAVLTNRSADGNQEYVPLKQSQQNPQLISNGAYGGGVLVGHSSTGYQDPRFSYDGIQTPIPWFDGPAFSDPYARSTDSYARSTDPNAASTVPLHNTNLDSSRNHSARSIPQLMGFNAARPTPAAHGIVNSVYPANQMYGQCRDTFRPGFGFGSNMYDYRINDQWGMPFDGKYKPRGRGNGFNGYGNDNMDGLSELNRGPRANRFKNSKFPVSEDPTVVLDREQYNRADFPDRYSEAKFFIIKSYSEDDIHKSIKYNVWASTPNGNKKLDVAYKEAKDKAAECPVFLFFSVNTSGQFVGVAEMVSTVDFNKTVDCWQQDKWNGCFDVKWHIVKDVPNNVMKHITIESNDNKPVTNSRDTQEVMLEQGLQVLKIFKEHVSKTSILDDFGFYEARQKVIEEKRSKHQQVVERIVEVRSTNPIDVEKGKEGFNVNPGSQKSLEPVSVLKEEVISAIVGDRKHSLPPAADGDTPV